MRDHAGELAKPQSVRVADVFVIGPLMVWFGTSRRTSAMPAPARAAMTAFGVGTILYNAHYYELNRRDQERRRSLLEAWDP